jgi:hypothetical protein
MYPHPVYIHNCVVLATQECHSDIASEVAPNSVILQKIFSTGKS